MNTRRRKKRKISIMAVIILSILGIVLVGDIIGAVIYLRQTPEIRSELISYLVAGDSMSFLEIFWQQFLYQLTIWTMGLLVIGNLVNIFLLFMRGVSAGFNMTIVAQNASAGVLVLWLIQYFLIIFTTILSVYFSLRFAYLVYKTLRIKKYKFLKKHLRVYATQFLFIVVLTMLSATFSRFTNPFVQEQISNAVTEINMEDYN